MKIILKKPNEVLQVREIEEIDITFLQKEVEGYIELVQLRNYVRLFKNDNYVLIVNDEGLMRQLPINFVFPDTGTKIHGPIIAAKFNSEGDLMGLSEKDIKRLTNYLEEITYGKRTSESLI